MNSLQRGGERLRAFPEGFFLAAAIVVVSLAGCGGKNAESAKVDADGDQSAPVVVPVNVANKKVQEPK